MYSTGYTGVSSFLKPSGYLGGFCKWYYTPVENILTWPSINPVTQKGNAKPVLKNGAFWYTVPRSGYRQSSLDETPKTAAPGHYYEWRFNVQLAGANPVLLQNAQFRRFIILGIPRFLHNAWLLVGTPQSPLRFEASIDSGRHWTEDALTKSAFIGECRHRSIIIPFTEEEINNGPDLDPVLLTTEEGELITTEDGFSLTI